MSWVCLGRRHSAVGPALVMAAILAAAILLRLPNLQLVPHLTDETAETLWAYDIAFNGARPVTHADSYYGPLWPYLVAGVMRAAGPSPVLPRLFTFALALPVVVLTGVLAALLAPADSRTAAGLVGAALMATGFTHALVNSRVAWSNSTTPLWTTLSAVVLVSAAQRGSRYGLVLAGVLAGLALHSHPAVVVFLAGLGLWFVLAAERRRQLHTVAPLAAVAAAIVAYSPLIVHNARTGLETLEQARQSSNAVSASTPGTWATGVVDMLHQLGRSLAGGFGPVGPAPDATVFSWVYVALAIAATVVVAHSRGLPVGRRLPLIVLAVSAICLPAFNANWSGFLEARYLGFLWPLAYASGGAAVTDTANRLRRRDPRGRLWRPLMALGIAALVALPAARVLAFDRQALAARYDNRRLWSMLEAAELASRDGAVVLVDRGLKVVGWRAGGNPRRAVEYMLTMQGVPYVRAPADKINHFLAEGGDLALFLSGKSATRFVPAYDLRAIDVQPRPGEEPWGLYRSPPAEHRGG